MAEIINLRQARKAIKRKEKETRASSNRIKFGRTKDERDRLVIEKKKQDSNLDGKKRED